MNCTRKESGYLFVNNANAYMCSTVYFVYSDGEVVIRFCTPQGYMSIPVNMWRTLNCGVKICDYNEQSRVDVGDVLLILMTAGLDSAQP